MFLKKSMLFLIPALFLSLFACSENESPGEIEVPEVPEEIVDTFNYIVLRNDGALFTIGDNTGMVNRLGSISGIEFNTFFNSVTSSGSKIFIYEHRFDPPGGIIYVWDKVTGRTQSSTLTYPAEFGENTALVSLDWDEENQNLVGITRENPEQDNNQRPIKIVRINPNNFQMTSQDINLSPEGYENVFSTSLIGQKLYAVATENNNVMNSDLLEIDLDQDSFTSLPLTGVETGITNIGSSGDSNMLFGFSPVANSNIMAEVRPVIYNIQTGVVTKLSEVPRLSVLNPSHKTFYNEEGEEFAEIVGSNNLIQLFKFSPATGNYELVKIANPEEFSTTLITIIGVRKI